MFLFLPFLLVVASVFAAPLEVDTSHLTQFTSETFSASIASGTWFIEFFSPFCGHCRHFAPTWVQLASKVHEEAVAGTGKTLGVKLAQVNCITDGDLCGDQKVRGYPTLRMYKDGSRVEDFNDNRDYDLLLDFIAKHAPPPPPTPPSPKEKATTTEITPMRVQTSRSTMATNPNINPKGEVLPLTPSNFSQAVDSGAVFIKFFAPWCGHCKKLAPTWKSLAERMQNKMTIAEVNCDTYSSFCTQQGVEGFPMLFFYRQGHKLDYTGKRTLDAMQSFTEKVMEPSVKELDKTWNTADILREHEVAFVFLHLTVDARALKVIQDVGNSVLMNPPVSIYTSTSPELRGQFGQTSAGSALFVIKANPDSPNAKDIKPTASLLVTASTSADDIRAFLDQHKYPLVTELTSENFQSVMNAPGKPLVLLMASQKDTLASDVRMLRAAGEKWRKVEEEGKMRRDMLWVYMDADKWGSWLKSMYGLKKERFPAFVIADHSKLIYYDQYKSGKDFELSPAGLVEAAEEASLGHLSHKNSENIFERMARRATRYLDSVGKAFSEHPFSMAALCLVAIGLFMWFIFRLLSDDIGGGMNGSNGRAWAEKSRRLD